MPKDHKSPIDPILLAKAKEMRHDPAPAEKKLWRLLRDRQLGGFKFRRQYPVNGYIADFFCHEVSLVLELDGDSHVEQGEYDQVRSEVLARDGLCVLRFWNTDVFDYPDVVLEEILRNCEWLRGGGVPSPQPSPGGRGSEA